MQILLADDHELVRDSIAAFIRSALACPVAVVADLPEAVTAARRGEGYDLVILDYQMPGMSGLRGLREMVSLQGVRPVALLSGSMPPALVEQAFHAGAHGYLPKSMAAGSLIAALRMILAGEKYAPPHLILQGGAAGASGALPSLTFRETAVLRHVCRGMTNHEIATALGLHEATVKVHVRSICTKIDARNRTQATIIAREAGFF